MSVVENRAVRAHLLTLHMRPAICYDEHGHESAYVISQCGHILCRHAARSVALAAIKCVPA